MSVFVICQNESGKAKGTIRHILEYGKRTSDATVRLLRTVVPESKRRENLKSMIESRDVPEADFGNIPQDLANGRFHGRIY